MPGSRYEEFKKELLRIEFESKLERKIMSEEDFRQACLDYLRLGQARSDSVPAKYENQVFACYSCGKTVQCSLKFKGQNQKKGSSECGRRRRIPQEVHT